MLAARLRYKAPLYLNIAATLCGLATLAKGIAGLGLPVLVFLAYLGFTWNWKRLRRAQIGLGILLALLTCAVVAIPWHHAMLIRHGKPFWDELYGDNHWRRLVVGRHGDRGSFEYFLRELGYAVLPWIALAPAALGAAVMRRRGWTASPAEARRQGIFWFGAIWFVAAYALVSLSVTKFHHYILPAIPGLAHRDRLLPRRSADAARRPRAAAAAALVGIPLLALVVHDLAGAAQGRAALHLAVLVRLHQHARRAAVAARARLPRAAHRLRGPVRGSRRSRSAGAASSAPPRSASAWPRSRSRFFLLDRYMLRVTPYWTQKGLVANYYKLRRSPDEQSARLADVLARRELLHARTRSTRGPRRSGRCSSATSNVENLKSWMDKHRGRRAFFLVERSRWSQLEGVVPADTKPSLKMVDDSNMKFCLGQIDL